MTPWLHQREWTEVVSQKKKQKKGWNCWREEIAARNGHSASMNYEPKEAQTQQRLKSCQITLSCWRSKAFTRRRISSQCWKMQTVQHSASFFEEWRVLQTLFSFWWEKIMKFHKLSLNQNKRNAKQEFKWNVKHSGYEPMRPSFRLLSPPKKNKIQHLFHHFRLHKGPFKSPPKKTLFSYEISWTNSSNLPKIWFLLLL